MEYLKNSQMRVTNKCISTNRKNISVRQRKYKKRLSERAVKNNLMKIHKNEFYLIFDIY